MNQIWAKCCISSKTLWNACRCLNEFLLIICSMGGHIFYNLVKDGDENVLLEIENFQWNIVGDSKDDDDEVLWSPHALSTGQLWHSFYMLAVIGRQDILDYRKTQIQLHSPKNIHLEICWRSCFAHIKCCSVWPVRYTVFSVVDAQYMETWCPVWLLDSNCLYESTLSHCG